MKYNLNLLRSIISLIRKKTIIKNHPIHLQIEPTTSCNLNCNFCISKFDRSNKMMSYSNFKKIMDIFHPNSVTFSGRGEPLLNLDLQRMIDYCKQTKIVTSITTNFTLGGELSDDLIKAGVGSIRVSIDSSNKNTYKKIRGVDSFDSIIDGINKINSIKAKYKLKRPFLFFEYVILDDNFFEIPSILKLASKININYINFRFLQVYDKILDKKSDLIGKITHKKNKDKLNEYLSIADDLGVNTNLDEIILNWGDYCNYCNLKKTPKQTECLHPWLQCFVSCDGQVAPCCSLLDNEGESFGNIFTHDFYSVWNGEKFRAIRGAFVNKKTIYNSCKTCPSKDISFFIKKAFKYKF